MAVFIVLYRGINVLGKNSVRMESLRAMHEGLGHRQVKSYIQSGNIIVSAKAPAAAIARKVSAAFAEEFGFSAKVMVIDAGQLRAVVEGNPYARFAAANHKCVHAGICSGEPCADALKSLLAKTGGTESVEVRSGVVYLHTHDGFGKSKFAARLEKACGVPITMRNWRTIEALWEMAKAELEWGP